MPSDTVDPGFRLSTLDAFVLVVGGAFAANIAIAHFWFGVAIAFAIGHFFCSATSCECGERSSCCGLRRLWRWLFARPFGICGVGP